MAVVVHSKGESGESEGSDVCLDEALGGVAQVPATSEKIVESLPGLVLWQLEETRELGRRAQVSSPVSRGGPCPVVRAPAACLAPSFFSRGVGYLLWYYPNVSGAYFVRGLLLYSSPYSTVYTARKSMCHQTQRVHKRCRG